MTECLVYTTWDQWIDRAESETRLQQFAPGDARDSHPRTCRAEAAAINTMEDYLRKRGFHLPLDPPLATHVVEHILSLGMEFLTMRSENKVDNIDKNAKLARTFFKEVSLGHNSLSNADSTVPQFTNIDFIYRVQPAVMNPDDDDSLMNFRMPPI